MLHLGAAGPAATFSALKEHREESKAITRRLLSITLVWPIVARPTVRTTVVYICGIYYADGDVTHQEKSPSV